MDAVRAVASLPGTSAEIVWHEQESLEGYDCILLPGGFSYGDYLRAGAIARFSPVMVAVREFAARGAPVLGICNGFQILTEAGLLPGALRSNECRSFRCCQTAVAVVSTQTPFTCACEEGELLRLPIAHAYGSYTADASTLRRLWDSSQVVLQYADENPNGSADAIAAICNDGRNVVGMMPHPERATSSLLGSSDGTKIFASLLAATMETAGA